MADTSSPPPQQQQQPKPTKSNTDLTKSDRKSVIGNYEVSKSLGEGSFAKVKLATHRLTGQKVNVSPDSNSNIRKFIYSSRK